MPCRDGREHLDEQNRQRYLDAMTAIMCGMLSDASQDAMHYAVLWCSAHKELDRYRSEKRFLEQHKAAERCDEILNQAYTALCRR
jgi:hypothetical protein